MRWTYGGHATWLAECAPGSSAPGLRLLFDPILRDELYGGALKVERDRTQSADRLRPDFIFVSHRHPDHFDPKSLAQLASLDGDAVVVTSDNLVASACERLGFSSVRVIPPATRVQLAADVVFVTTPSRSSEPEWGVAVACGPHAVWNTIDTTFANPAELARVGHTALECLGDASSGFDQFDVALVRGQPTLEVEAQLGEAAGFPFAAYDELLRQAASCPARVLVPTACGLVHSGVAEGMNRLAYPVGAADFVEDVARVEPGRPAEMVRPGAGFELKRTSGDVKGVRWLGCSPGDAEDPPSIGRYRPFEVPPMVGVGSRARHGPAIDDFVHGRLRLGLSRALLVGERDPPLRLMLEVIGADNLWTYRFAVTHENVSIEVVDAPVLGRRFDLINTISAEALARVLGGRDHWGIPLLAGALRVCDRSYLVGPAGLKPRRPAPIFLYYGLPYDESVERWVASEVSLALG